MSDKIMPHKVMTYDEAGDDRYAMRPRRNAGEFFGIARKSRLQTEQEDSRARLLRGQPDLLPLLYQESHYKAANISLAICKPRDKVILRGQKSALSMAVKKVLGLDMPSPLHFSAPKRSEKLLRLSWCSPDEWLLNCPLGSADDLMAQLSPLLKNKHHGLVNVSDYYSDIVLDGNRALELINKGSPINTDPRFFAAGDVVGTRYGNATILLTYLPKQWEIQVRSSFVPYLWQYLLTAAREFG